MANNITEQHIATVEFTGGYDARTKNLGRLAKITATDQGVRVVISAEAPEGNCRFVTLSDETMTPDMFNRYVRPILQGTGAVRVGHL